MLKKMIKYIFIYTICVIFIGCESNVLGPSGIYHLDYDDGEIQTFTQLRAYVGYEMEHLGWTTDTSFEGCTWGHCEDVPIVNGSCYTNDDGYGYQMVGVMEENIGQIATIWVGYYDDYGNQWIDSIRIMIDE